MSSQGAADEVIRPGLLVVLLLVVVGALYAPALSAGFMWDDRLLIVQSPLVTELGPLRDHFTQPFWGESAGAAANTAYFRPLLTLSYALDWQLHRGNPTGFHLTNLLLHVVNTGLVYAYARRFTATGSMAVAAAALWALQPRLAEAVAWTSGRSDVLASTFTLAALCLPSTRAGRISAALLLFCGLLVKEVALAGIVALAAREWLAGRDARPAKRWRAVLPPLAALAAYLAVRAALYGFASQTGKVGFFGRLGLIVEAVGRYVFMLLDPFQPNALLGRVGAPDLKFVAVGAIALFLAAAAVPRLVRAGKRSAAWLEPLALALVGIALVLHLWPIPTRTVASDRFLYLPLVGLVALLAAPLERLLARSGIARLATLALVVGLGASTLARARLWADEVAFWVNEQAKAPSVTVALVELTGVYYRAGLYAEALELSRRALATGDGYKLSAYNEFLCLSRLGRSAEARARLMALEKRTHQSYARDFAILALQEWKLDEARAILEAILARDPRATRERELLGLSRDVARARAALHDPSFAASEAGRVLRAELALRVQRYEEGIRLWFEILETTRDPALAVKAATETVRVGQLPEMERAVQVLKARFGTVPPELDGVYHLRRTEMEAALEVKGELGL